jgi:hypothetical protein
MIEVRRQFRIIEATVWPYWVIAQLDLDGGIRLLFYKPWHRYERIFARVVWRHAKYFPMRACVWACRKVYDL